ncbi:MAG: LON peptidase substrate-binding domain-containing protein [Cyclobacteriaceae bacterium]|jgi:hypothetical protein|nr:hypothetical protein [Flammeovirgaceae bacterium]
MSELIKIPMFPLSIFPLPGELVPLHIFEPRYKQLLQEAETKDIGFGIFFNHPLNEDKFGSWVKLESVIKRYPGGESDIIVKCLDLFTMETLYRTYRDKLYPGGDIHMMSVNHEPVTQIPVLERYHAFAQHMNIKSGSNASLWQIANDLNLDFPSRLKLVSLDEVKQLTYLSGQLSYQLELLQFAEKSKDVFHLN